MTINSINAISFAKKVLNSGKNLKGIKPKLNINLNEADKFIYMTQPIKNPSTGNIVATVPSDLPPLKEGWVRLIHRTQPEYTESILKSGLRGKYGISGTTTAHDTQDFWKSLQHEQLKFHGTKKIVIDMPAKEHRKLYIKDKYYKDGSIKDETGYNNAKNLYVKNKYIVGIIDAYGTHKQLTPKQLASMKKSSELNQFLEIKPEDLRQLNPGRPQNRDWKGRTPSQAKKEAEKLQKEIAKREAAASQEIKTPQAENLSFEELFDGWN